MGLLVWSQGEKGWTEISGAIPKNSLWTGWTGLITPQFTLNRVFFFPSLRLLLSLIEDLLTPSIEDNLSIIFSLDTWMTQY